MSRRLLRRRGEFFVTKDPKTERGENETAGDVDQMMLVSQDGRKRDQDEPNHDRNANQTARVAKINVDQNQHQCCVERWKQIVGCVHSAKPIEDRAEKTIGMRPRKREMQREKQETSSGDNDRSPNAFGQDRQFAIGSAKKRRDDEEEIDRHIGQDEKRHERKRVFPFEIKRADIRTPRADPVATAVDDQEQDRQCDRNGESFSEFRSHVSRLRP